MEKKPTNLALRNLSYGIYAIGADDGGNPTGCIVNTVLQVTSDPAEPMVSFCVSKERYTKEIIGRTGKFSVSILSEKTDPSVIGSLGFSSGNNSKEKFKNVDYTLKDGLPLISSNTCGHLICEVIGSHDADENIVIYAKVKSTIQGEDLPPMTYRYYHSNVKVNKESPNSDGEEMYVCSICGYIYKGDITKEPDDYVCPICGAGKDKFVKKA